jgi:hypothetical protein
VDDIAEDEEDTKISNLQEALADGVSHRENTINGVKVVTWFPDWESRVTHKVNAEFLNHLAHLVIRNEEVSAIITIV